MKKKEIVMAILYLAIGVMSTLCVQKAQRMYDNVLLDSYNKGVYDGMELSDTTWTEYLNDIEGH
jgi:hypothetical protein|tara:strand:- start:1218 stop:1409 length:192 start_codon:yes stop_codon:yes gene_type:complete